MGKSKKRRRREGGADGGNGNDAGNGGAVSSSQSTAGDGGSEKKKRKRGGGGGGKPQSQQRKRPRQSSYRHGRHNKKERFWIESAADSVPPKKGALKSGLSLVITRVELTDDHVHVAGGGGGKGTVSAAAAAGAAPPSPKIADERNKKKEAADERTRDDDEATAAPKREDEEAIEVEDGDDVSSEEKKENGAEGATSGSAGAAEPDEVGRELQKGESPGETDGHSHGGGVFDGGDDDAGDDSRGDERDAGSGQVPEAAPAPTVEAAAVAKEGDNGDGTKNKDEVAKKPDKRQPFITVRRAASAKGKLKWHMNRATSGDDPFVPLPDGDCGDGIKNPHPKSEVADKYWAQRRRLFARFDDGIQLDREGWYSVTPEAIALHVARRTARLCASSEVDTTPSSPPPAVAVVPKEAAKGDGDGDGDGDGAVILDVFCGSGGNAIAFARLSPDEVKLVVCVDNDRSKLRMAAHNAAVYRISPDRMVLIEADAVQVLDRMYRNGMLMKNAAARDGDEGDSAPDGAIVPTAIEEVHEGYRIGGVDLLPPSIDAVFLSPPWGGTDYGKAGRRGFDVASCIKVRSNRLTSNDLAPSDAAVSSINKVAAAGKNTGTGREADADATDGEKLLTIAAKAARDMLTVYFLPKNTNGVFLGRSALKAGYHSGSFEMEQSVLNGKLKTITAYFGRDCSHL